MRNKYAVRINLQMIMSVKFVKVFAYNIPCDNYQHLVLIMETHLSGLNNVLFTWTVCNDYMLFVSKHMLHIKNTQRFASIS